MGKRAGWPIVRAVRRFLQRLRGSRLVPLAIAVAFGFALWDLGQGVAYFLLGFVTETEYTFGRALTWNVGGRLIDLSTLARALIELAVVGLAAWVLLRRDKAEAESSK